MQREFTLEFWEDDGWYVGKLKEVPGVFSQGETLEELEENIADAYRLVSEENSGSEHPPAQTKGIFLDVA
jgi:predicted RNase H-like HicB family nuclease